VRQRFLPVFPAPGSNRELFLLLLFGFLFLGLGIGMRSPWPADEPRFAQIALEMIQSGDWMFPHRGGELYPDKPPVFVWMQAVFYLLTGSMAFAFLLPSLLSALVVLALVYDLCRRFYGNEIARYGVLLLLCTIQFVMQAKKGQIDMTVCMWITLGNYGLLRHFLEGPDWRWYYAGWFAMGLGVITKGVGFLPALLCLPYLWLSLRHARHDMTLRGAILHLLGIVVMLAAIALWVLPMVLEVGQLGDAAHLAYRDNILMRQTTERYVSGVGGHSKPFYYYIVAVIPALWFPLSILLPWLTRRWISAARKGDTLVILVFTWSLLVLLFFSLSPGKRGVYVLPILPMLALIAAPYLPEILAMRRIKSGAWISAVVCGALLVVGALAALALDPDFIDKLPLEGNVSWLFVLMLGLALLIPAWTWRHSQPVKGLFVGLCLVWVLYSTWGYRLMEPFRSPRDMMQEVNRIAGIHSELAIVDFREQLLLFSGRAVTHFGYHSDKGMQQRAAARWLSEAPSQRWLLVPLGNAYDCFDVRTAIEMDLRHRRSWYLARFDNLLSEEELQSNGCDWLNTDLAHYQSPAVDPGWQWGSAANPDQ